MNSDLPRISIVIISLNQGEYLEQTIKSILEQNYKNLELILIDGGSTDCSIEIIKKYQKYLTYCVSEKDSGQTSAIIKGLKKATGEIFAWQNSDDLYLPNTFSIVSKIFSEDSNLELLFGGWNYIDNKGKLLSTRYLKRYSLLQLKSGFRVPPQPAVFFRRNIIFKVGGLDANKKYVMDYDLYVRIANKNNLKITNEVLGSFRLHSASKTFNNNSEFVKELYSSRERYFKEKKIFSVLFIFFSDSWHWSVRYFQKKTGYFSFRNKIKLKNGG